MLRQVLLAVSALHGPLPLVVQALHLIFGYLIIIILELAGIAGGLLLIGGRGALIPDHRPLIGRLHLLIAAAVQIDLRQLRHHRGLGRGEHGRAGKALLRRREIIGRGLGLHHDAKLCNDHAELRPGKGRVDGMARRRVDHGIQEGDLAPVRGDELGKQALQKRLAGICVLELPAHIVHLRLGGDDQLLPHAQAALGGRVDGGIGFVLRRRLIMLLQYPAQGFAGGLIVGGIFDFRVQALIVFDAPGKFFRVGQALGMLVLRLFIEAEAAQKKDRAEDRQHNGENPNQYRMLHRRSPSFLFHLSRSRLTMTDG